MSLSRVVYRDADLFAAIVPRSDNVKTGDMQQVYILPTVNPIQAMKLGLDRSVCGDCPLSSKANGGTGACYVVTAQGPTALWKAVHDKPVVPAAESTKPIRLGAYGDPAFLPLRLVRKLVKGRRHTGYTHQWHKRGDWSPLLMASIDPTMAKRQGLTSIQLKHEAQAKGYRTFRVLAEGEALDKDEIYCPFVTHGIQCADCGLCNGSKPNDRRKCIVVPAHGSGKNLLEIA